MKLLVLPNHRISHSQGSKISIAGVDNECLRTKPLMGISDPQCLPAPSPNIPRFSMSKYISPLLKTLA